MPTDLITEQNPARSDSFSSCKILIFSLVRLINFSSFSHARINALHSPVLYLVSDIVIGPSEPNRCSSWTVLSSDGLWSTHLPNGTWMGLFGMLQRNEIDIALGLGTIHKQSSERGTQNS